MKNLITLNQTVGMLESQKESKLLHEAVIMQEFLSFFEELSMEGNEFAETIQAACLALIKQDPTKAEKSLNAFAIVSKLLRMSATHSDLLIDKSNEYYTIQKEIERIEQVKFSANKKAV